jgi:hypothetical protein
VIRDLPFHMRTDLDLGYALSLGLVFWFDQKIIYMY